jgi:hypothetical protein
MLTGRVRGVYNNHGAVGTVTDAVRYVTEQKLFPTRHAKIADHQDIDCFLLSGADDRQCWISINDDQGMTAVPGDLPREVSQFIVGSCCARLFGFAEFCGRRILRHYHLYHEQLSVVAVGKSGGPLDSSIGGFGAVGAYHYAPYNITLQMIFHKLNKPFSKNRSKLQNQLL